MSSLNRRDFIKDSAVLAALAAAGGFGKAIAGDKSEKDAKSTDAGSQLRVAVIGVHGRGKDHVHGFAGKNNCVVTTICDADSAVIGDAMKAAEKAQGTMPQYEQDIRKVVEDKNIDVISIATPNHWHSLAAIWGLQNGKNVYVEKPVSHNVSEGRRVVEVARKTKLLCQAGTQSRSSTGLIEAMQFLRDGKLGKITVARGLCYKPRGSIGKVSGPQEPPKTVDYNLWTGPAPLEPVMRKQFHYDWHWFWDYGCGDLGNQGIHEMDKSRWALGKSELAQSVFSLGGRFGYTDDGQTANTQICVFDYGDAELIFEVRGLKTDALRNAKVGNIIYGSEGYLVIPDYSDAIAFTNSGELIKKFGGGGDHFANFVAAVRSGKPELLHADIEEGHISSALCHLGNISYRLGTERPFDKVPEALTYQWADETFERMEKHLVDNQVSLTETPCRVGRRLKLDPQTETFIGDKEADAMLTREYRKGFEVPAKA
ncbi:MAG TPA: Gfo/Idh/MocA family oxidoreductase [Gemmataceae bacterium]|nr:Gfo/Idh/MocA family oxidoreductase [Gemmataceae bacterium]